MDVHVYCSNPSKLTLISIFITEITKKSNMGESVFEWLGPESLARSLQAPEVLHRHCPLSIPIHNLVECSLGDLFLVPWEIHVSQVEFDPGTSRSTIECATNGPMCTDNSVGET